MAWCIALESKLGDPFPVLMIDPDEPRAMERFAERRGRAPGRFQRGRTIDQTDPRELRVGGEPQRAPLAGEAQDHSRATDGLDLGDRSIHDSRAELFDDCCQEGGIHWGPGSIP